MDTAPVRNTVISVRVDSNSLQAIDLLVKAGLAQSRSEAAAQFVAIGIRSADDLLLQAREVADRLQRLKSELVVAIKAKDVAGVRAVLEQDPSLLRRWTREGETPVLLSIRSGTHELTQLLLERGAELDAFEAAAIGDVQQVRQFLDADAKLIGARSHDGWALLHMASYFGHAEVAQLLLDRGADVHIRSVNELGNTPLHSALAGRRYDLADVLVRHGADVNALNARGWAPLHYAACTGHAAVVHLLQHSGARQDVKNADGLTPAQLAKDRGYSDIAERLAQDDPQPAASGRA